MFGLGAGEILIILVAALIFIGPKKLPGLARTLGKGLSEFQNAARGISTQVQNTQAEVSRETKEDNIKSDTSNSRVDKPET